MKIQDTKETMKQPLPKLHTNQALPWFQMVLFLLISFNLKIKPVCSAEQHLLLEIDSDLLSAL